MVRIYSTDGEKLFTDQKKRFYIDASLLRERAYYLRRAALLDQIALVLGFRSFDALDTFTRSQGVTPDVLMTWILTGVIADRLHCLAVQ